MDVKENEAITFECDGITYYFCSEGCKEKFIGERTCKLLKKEYDLIVIGGGPAGLTAAVYAATLKMNAFLIAKDVGGQAIDSTKIENYMGFDFITGPELAEKFQYQLIHSHHIDHLISEVEKIEPVEGGFNVTTSEMNNYFAKTLLVATGMTRKRLTADTAIIERVRQFNNLTTYEGYKVVEFSGDKTLSEITIRKKAEEEKLNIPVKGVFIAIGLRPNSSLVSEHVKLNESGEIVINPDCSTSYPGIYAAGDVTNAFGKRIIIASGEGAKAALAARQYILNLRKVK